MRTAEVLARAEASAAALRLRQALAELVPHLSDRPAQQAALKLLPQLEIASALIAGMEGHC